MFSDKYLMFKNRLEKVFKHRSKISKRQQIYCFRIYDRDLPEFPLIIEWYSGKVYVAEYKSQHKLSEEEYEEWFEKSLEVIKAVTNLSDDNIYCKSRQRKADRFNQYQKTGNLKEEFIVEEDGLKFLVNLSDYLDTGLFLDHRITRGMVKANISDKKFLNLFCYTGSFTVYAATGGAAETWSIDLSNTYIDWARRNLMLNTSNLKCHRFIKADVLQFLPEIPDNYFDVIVLDPPSFSNSKMMKDILDIQRDHEELINNCLTKLKTGGCLYFSTNLRTFKLNHEAILSSSIKDITAATTPFDFENKLLRYCYLIEK